MYERPVRYHPVPLATEYYYEWEHIGGNVQVVRWRVYVVLVVPSTVAWHCTDVYSSCCFTMYSNISVLQCCARRACISLGGRNSRDAG